MKNAVFTNAQNAVLMVSNLLPNNRLCILNNRFWVAIFKELCLPVWFIVQCPVLVEAKYLIVAGFSSQPEYPEVERLVWFQFHCPYFVCTSDGKSETNIYSCILEFKHIGQMETVYENAQVFKKRLFERIQDDNGVNLQWRFAILMPSLW